MKELLKRVLNARTIGYPLPPSIVKEIEAELEKPEPPSQKSELLEEIEQLKSAINLKERDLIERENAVKSWADALEIERNEHKETKKQLEAELAKPETDYRRVLKEINEFIKADILPEEIKAELAKPEPEPVAWITTDCRPTSLITGNERTARGWALNGIPTAPLYTHPPAQQKPLSDDEVRIIINSTFRTDTGWIEDFMILVRSVEQAHGIK